jgi:hypothetical protein
MSTTKDDPFKIQVNDVLGIDHSAYRAKVYALALSDPSKYYRIREQIVSAIKDTAVKNIYEIIYSFLKDGVAGPGISLESANMIGCKPKYPSSKINTIALGAAESLDNIIEETIKICLPANYDDIAQKKLTQKGEALSLE